MRHRPCRGCSTTGATHHNRDTTPRHTMAVTAMADTATTQDAPRGVGERYTGP